MEKPKLDGVNLLDLTPVQRVAWGENDDGTVYLKKPKARSTWLKLLIKKLGKRPFIHIHLDDYGSHVWHECDGRHRVEQIGESLRQAFGQSIEPVYERLGVFIQMVH